MAEVALTTIALGHEVDGKYERVDVKAGDKLPTWVPAADKKALRENGALGEPQPTQEEIDSKDAEIERLKALLSEAQAANAPQEPADPKAK